MLLPTLLVLTFCVSLGVSDNPALEDVRVVPVKDQATNDVIPYEVSWTLQKTDSLINITLQVYIPVEGNKGKVLVMRNGTDGYGQGITVPLEYYTTYLLEIYSFYNEANGVQSKKLENSTSTTTIAGSSTSVKSLKAAQAGPSNKISLTWGRPEHPRGPLSRYDVEVKFKNGTDVTYNATVDNLKNMATVTIGDAQFGPVYNISVTPVNKQVDDDSDIVGETATVNIVLKTGGSGGFPLWAIVLIVVIVLAVAAGGAFYFVKTRR